MARQERITYLCKGIESNFRRVGDIVLTVTLYGTFEQGGLLYGYRDPYRINVTSVCKEDIISRTVA